MTAPAPRRKTGAAAAFAQSASLDEHGVDGVTRAIARFAHEFRLERVPSTTRLLAHQVMVDSLACAFGGADCAAAEMGRRLAPEPPNGDPGGYALIRGRRTTADAAAFINGTMIRFLDYNDSFPTAHPSDCIGALLGVAAVRDVSGSDLLTAVIVSYEVFNRLTEATRMRYLGWDQGAAVAVGVAAGLGNMLKLDENQIVHAVSLAAVACVPLRATRAGRLSLWKGAASAQSAREATYLTQLVQLGMTGPTAAFEGRHGHWELITGPFEMRPFPPNGEFLIEKVRLKYWPLEYNIQIVVAAALELRQRITIDKLCAVNIGTYWSAWHETGSEAEKWAPQTRETADHSMPYIFARALLDGHIGVESFEPEAFRAPDVLELMQRISVHEDPEVEAKYPATVAVNLTATTTADEEITIAMENPRGHDLNRMTQEETSEKFRREATPILGETRTAEALAFWWNLEEESSTFEGVRLLEGDRHDRR